MASDPAAEVRAWAADGPARARRARLWRRATPTGAALVYGATGDAGGRRARRRRSARAAGALVNIVDDLEGSDFITPAIVDRDPVTVAIGTEGAAPVLARKIKAEVEAMLPATLGLLTRIGQGFRARVEALDSKARRAFWTRFYFERGPRALAGRRGGGARRARGDARRGRRRRGEGVVHLVGTGPGDPELLTLKARRLLHEADVVVHDRLVPPAILELARREATIVEVGKTAYGPSWKQDDINALIVAARAGRRDGRAAEGRRPGGLRAARRGGRGAGGGGRRATAIVPGVTSASAAAAAIGQSLTKRGRNSAFRILTGHDVDGFAEHDWRELAKPGATAAVYMGVKAATFVRGRLLMHGAPAETPVTAVENASRPGQRVIATTLIELPAALAAAAPDGPVMILYGPRAAGGGAGARRA